MIGVDDLSAVEEQAYKTTWEDGILDLVLGGSLITIGLLFRTDLAGLAGVFVAVLAMPAWGIGKKFITVPRLGYVAFGRERKTKEKRWSLSLAAVGVATLVVALGLFAAQSNGGSLQEVLVDLRAGYVLFGVLIAVGMALAGWMIDLPRLKAYAGIVLAATGIGYFTGVALEDYLLASGLVVSTWGAVVLRRFLGRYPLPEDPTSR
jgi:hypothetical protein